MSAWEAELKSHPDSEFSAFLVDGIKHGFCDHSSHVGASAAKNTHSAGEHPEPIDHYIWEEVDAGHIIRLHSGEAGGEGVHVSRFGVIPKPHQPGKWRLITDLSSPKGSSVNDGISPSLCLVSYATVDNAVRCIVSLGHGAMMATFDIASAYQIVLVHPVDRLLLGMRWKGDLYVHVDGALPFGLRSAPKLFTAVADALLWIMGGYNVIHAMHYLDDFLILGPPDTDLCRWASQFPDRAGHHDRE